MSERYLHGVKAEKATEHTMMISPRQFIDWYRKADLELIVGVGDQEIDIRSNSDLWKGLKVYIHQYSLKPGEKNNLYWDIERNRFNPKNELFQIRKKLFKNHYELFGGVILQKAMSTVGMNDIKQQKYSIDRMAIKLNGLVDYMNCAAFIRKKIINTLKSDELEVQRLRNQYTREYNRVGLVPSEQESAKFDLIKSRQDPLRKLLLAIDDPSIMQLPACIAPSYFTKRYREIMIGRNV